MTLDIEGVLAGHEWKWVMFQRRPEMICACGDPLVPLHSSFVATLDHHRAHIAAVLREQIAAWLGSDAAANAAQVGVHAIESCEPDPSVEQYAASVLAALAAQVAPSRVPGEES